MRKKPSKDFSDVCSIKTRHGYVTVVEKKCELGDVTRMYAVFTVTPLGEEETVRVHEKIYPIAVEKYEDERNRHRPVWNENFSGTREDYENRMDDYYEWMRSCSPATFLPELWKRERNATVLQYDADFLFPENSKQFTKVNSFVKMFLHAAVREQEGCEPGTDASFHVSPSDDKYEKATSFDSAETFVAGNFSGNDETREPGATRQPELVTLVEAKTRSGVAVHLLVQGWLTDTERVKKFVDDFFAAAHEERNLSEKNVAKEKREHSSLKFVLDAVAKQEDPKKFSYRDWEKYRTLAAKVADLREKIAKKTNTAYPVSCAAVRVGAVPVTVAVPEPHSLEYPPTRINDMLIGDVYVPIAERWFLPDSAVCLYGWCEHPLGHGGDHGLPHEHL